MANSFRARYKCFSVCFMQREKQLAEKGGKIFLPSSALQTLCHMDVQYPMVFKLENRENNRITHCGVLEFEAEEGTAYIPYWMMRNLLLEEGAIVDIENVSLPLATFAKFEPQSVDFLDISNPKATLEHSLRSFSCLTLGDMISIHYNDKVFEMKVLDTKPGHAISIIECDMSVDFAPPVGYVEPSRPVQPICGYDEDVEIDVSKYVVKKKQSFVGQGARLDGKVKATANKICKEEKPEYKRGVPNFEYNKERLTFIRVTNKNVGEQELQNDKKFTAFEGEGETLKKK